MLMARHRLTPRYSLFSSFKGKTSSRCSSAMRVRDILKVRPIDSFLFAYKRIFRFVRIFFFYTIRPDRSLLSFFFFFFIYMIIFIMQKNSQNKLYNLKKNFSISFYGDGRFYISFLFSIDDYHIISS